VGVKTPTAAAVGATLYLALLGSVVAYLLLNYGLHFVSAGRASAFTNVVPVIAVVGAFVVLGERFTAGQAVAAVVVLGGVFLANRGRRATSASSAARAGSPRSRSGG
jgi:drug/metabolite transporter (DMT)-like permease